MAAQWSKDKRWYRAQITDVLSDDDHDEVFVLFIDFGNTEILPMKRIRVLETRFLNLPFQAVQCCLHGVTSLEESWSFEAREELFAMVKRKTCVAEVVEVEETNVCAINLIALVDNREVDVGQHLVREGFGTKVKITGIPSLRSLGQEL